MVPPSSPSALDTANEDLRLSSEVGDFWKEAIEQVSSVLEIISSQDMFPGLINRPFMPPTRVNSAGPAPQQYRRRCSSHDSSQKQPAAPSSTALGGKRSADAMEKEDDGKRSRTDDNNSHEEDHASASPTNIRRDGVDTSLSPAEDNTANGLPLSPSHPQQAEPQPSPRVDPQLDTSHPRLRGLICNALASRGGLDVETISNEVRRYLPVGVLRHPDYDLDELLSTIRIILQDTPDVFECVTSDSCFKWHIWRGPGRASNTKRLNAMFDTSVAAAEHDIPSLGEQNWHIALVYHHEATGEEDSAGRVQMIERCEALVQQLWDAFGQAGREPPMGRWGTPTFGEKFWLPVCTGSGPLEFPSDGLLEDANEYAMDTGQPIKIRLVGEGWDGLDTENDSWAVLRTKYRYLDITLSLLIPKTAAPTIHHSPRQQPTAASPEIGDSAWVHYHVAHLHTLYERGYTGGLDPRILKHHQQFLLITRLMMDGDQDEDISSGLKSPWLGLVLHEGGMYAALTSGENALRRENRKMRTDRLGPEALPSLDVGGRLRGT